MKSTLVGFAAFCLGAVCLSTEAAAQQPVESRFSVDASIGWDNSISGDFLAAGIGELEGLPIVIQSTTFGDVYGTGAQWQFGVGYAIDAINEVRGQFTYQRVGSDVVTLGTAGVSTSSVPSTITRSRPSMQAFGTTLPIRPRSCAPTPARRWASPSSPRLTASLPRPRPGSCATRPTSTTARPRFRSA